MTRRYAFELHLPGAHRVGGWEADRHEVITTWVIADPPDEERGGAGTAVGVDCYRSREDAWAADLWWTFDQPPGAMHVARARFPAVDSGDGRDGRLRRAELGLLCAVRRLAGGQAAASPGDWHAGLWDDELAESFDAISAHEWATVPSLAEVVGDTSAVLGPSGRRGFVIHAHPPEKSRRLGSVTVTLATPLPSTDTATLTVEATADEWLLAAPRPRVRVAAPRWAEVVPLSSEPQERIVRGGARAGDVRVSFVIPT